MVNAALILALTIAGAHSADRQPYVEKIPGTLVSFKMAAIPDGKLGEHAIKGIWMSETEVTWDVFDIWAFRLDQSPADVAKGVDAQSRPSRPYGAPDRGFGHAGYAALGMTFGGAEQFCKWLSAKTNKKYRMPTEAEWEYAARAGSSSEPSDLESVAWYWDNAEDVAHPVGKKKPNAWGLFDMLGNTAEWAKDAEAKPVTCGGSWASKRPDVGFSARARQIPKWNDNDPQNPKSKWWLSNAPFVGFRVVCEE
jgi:formylglycine-generating enzyme required for sulfatase activity